MKKTFRISLLILLAVTSLPCFAHHMAVVVSKQNSTTALTSAKLGKIFREETRSWPDGTNIQLVLHRSSEGETATLANLNKMSPEEWKKWVAEHKDSVTLVDTDTDVLNYVQNTAGAIGLVEVHSVNAHVVVVHVDGKVPLEGGYLPH